MSPFDLDDVALVTGAANGIGRASALALARAGADVALLDLEGEPLAELAAEIRALGQKVLDIQLDCRDAEAMAEAIRRIEADLGAIGVLFNNVGQSARDRAGAFTESEEQTWQFVIEVSLLTTMRTSQLVVPSMVERGRGRIINMSTDAAFVGDIGLADYAAAKMGVIGFTRSLARELASYQINVNAIAPGAIRTRAHDRLPAHVIDSIREKVPLGRVGSVDDVANAVHFLASTASGYITGQTLLIDGGRWMI